MSNPLESLDGRPSFEEITYSLHNTSDKYLAVFAKMIEAGTISPDDYPELGDYIFYLSKLSDSSRPGLKLQRIYGQVCPQYIVLRGESLEGLSVGDDGSKLPTDIPVGEPLVGEVVFDKSGELRNDKVDGNSNNTPVVQQTDIAIDADGRRIEIRGSGGDGSEEGSIPTEAGIPVVGAQVPDEKEKKAPKLISEIPSEDQTTIIAIAKEYGINEKRIYYMLADAGKHGWTFASGGPRIKSRREITGILQKVRENIDRAQRGELTTLSDYASKHGILYAAAKTFPRQLGLIWHEGNYYEVAQLDTCLQAREKAKLGFQPVGETEDPVVEKEGGEKKVGGRM